VGGGAAGCVVARRLVEHSKSLRVLVLEAGGVAPSPTQVPAYYNQFADVQEIIYKFNYTRIVPASDDENALEELSVSHCCVAAIHMTREVLAVLKIDFTRIFFTKK
jgi:choline dehydrogenase-like flavoprotein